MKPVRRAAAKGGVVREVFQHVTYGGYDLKALQESVRDLTVVAENGKVHISLNNDCTGHTLPSGSVGRQLLIMTAVKDGNDKTIDMHRQVYEKGDNREKEDTSIPVDKKADLSYDLKVASGEIVVKVLYKNQATQKDREATEVTEKRVNF